MVSGSARRPSRDSSASEGAGVWLNVRGASKSAAATAAAAEHRRSERAFNGESRATGILHCIENLVDDPSRGRQTDDQEDQEEHQEQAGHELRDGERRAGNGRETEKCRKNTDDEKD